MTQHRMRHPDPWLSNAPMQDSACVLVTFVALTQTRLAQLTRKAAADCAWISVNRLFTTEQLPLTPLNAPPSRPLIPVNVQKAIETLAEQ
jgi:hypothetical protein